MRLLHTIERLRTPAFETSGDHLGRSAIGVTALKHFSKAASNTAPLARLEEADELAVSPFMSVKIMSHPQPPARFLGRFEKLKSKLRIPEAPQPAKVYASGSTDWSQAKHDLIPALQAWQAASQHCASQHFTAGTTNDDTTIIIASLRAGMQESNVDSLLG